MAEPFEIVVKFNKRAEICEARDFPFNNIARLMLVDKSIPGVWRKIFYRKRQAPVFSTDARNRGVDLLTFLQNFAGMLDAPCPGDIGNMAQAIDTVFDFNKG